MLLVHFLRLLDFPLVRQFVAFGRPCVEAVYKLVLGLSNPLKSRHKPGRYLAL